ncbi:hypothetical protein E4L96_01860 [Massilia arenosa]|uniref:Peptidase S8/S53 domain-containing protein n=2 Tax=Zemynaea arenosa TaxID=2561931 RepID=A0A4Y9SR00_9BURK|nr:hypothetical protein E4L96_01860 [Massilia arenosa]
MFRSLGCALGVAAVLLFSGADARAQLRLPSLQLPLPGRVGPLDTHLLQDPLRPVQSVAGQRLDVARELLRRHADVLRVDPRGFVAVAGQLVAVAPSAAGLAAAERLGLVRQAEAAGVPGEPEEDAVVILRVPAGVDAARVLAQLRLADPDGAYDFNHIYFGAEAAMGVAAGRSSGPGDGAGTSGGQRGRSGDGVADGVARPGAGALAGTDGAPARAGERRIGLVDSGVDARHIVFSRARIEQWGCGGMARPAQHGTAVASLMVGRARRFLGVAPEGHLYAADVYCDEPTGGSADRIAAALAWLGRQQVGVINLSIVGPPNVVLERVVANMIKRGHVLVAAVGNDGPAAAPLYPASYPGVVGVTAVDRNGQVLPEAAQGPQVMFAAPGHQMVSADWESGAFRAVRGTSFAAPIVAALLAEQVTGPDVALARRAVDALRLRAGGVRSPVLGFGVVGAEFRIDPGVIR